MNSRLLKRIFGKLSKFVHSTSKITFITGANAPFYASMKNNLLASISKYESNVKIIVWDLGLSDEQKQDLQKFVAPQFHSLLLMNYPEKDLPKHYAMKNWNYAFKSYCIYHSLPFIDTRYMFWLDAGCAIVAPLNAERFILDLYAFYSPYSSTSVGQMTNNKTLSEFDNTILQIASKQMLSGGVQGYNMKNRQAVGMLVIWYNLIRNEEIIAPETASLSNHRYDQAVLSLLYYSLNRKVPYLARYYYNIRIHLNKGL